MTEMEAWRPCREFPLHYEVSDAGRVRRSSAGRCTYAGRVLASWLTSGYPQVCLYVGDGVRYRRHVHRLVWEAFRGSIPAGLEVNHLNGVKTDARLNNLEVVTCSENNLHAHQIGLYPAGCMVRDVPIGENHPNAKLTLPQAHEILITAHSGLNARTLAERFGVSRHTIYAVWQGRNWRDALQAAASQARASASRLEDNPA